MSSLCHFSIIFFFPKWKTFPFSTLKVSGDIKSNGFGDKMVVLIMVIEHVINLAFCESDDVQISAVCKTEWKPKI